MAGVEEKKKKGGTSSALTLFWREFDENRPSKLMAGADREKTRAEGAGGNVRAPLLDAIFTKEICPCFAPPSTYDSIVRALSGVAAHRLRLTLFSASGACEL